MHNTINWLREHELPTGGIEAWEGNGTAYQEVTGYLIPTMWRYGEGDLAVRCSDWLLGIQQRDGAFSGLDGNFHTFDTAAAMEGLEATYNQTNGVKYMAGYLKAKKFITSNRISSGVVRRYPGDWETRVYTCRISGLIGDEKGMNYWTSPEADWFDGKDKQRMHYIAYALEGLWRGGRKDFVKKYLEQTKRAIMDDGWMPFTVYKDFAPAEASDTTATCQIALLYQWAGMTDYARLLKKAADSVIQPNGGVWHDKRDKRQIAWAAKYYLDACLDIA